MWYHYISVNINRFIIVKCVFSRRNPLHCENSYNRKFCSGFQIAFIFSYKHFVKIAVISLINTLKIKVKCCIVLKIDSRYCKIIATNFFTVNIPIFFPVSAL